ncbi:dTDP-4-amino-4,6-dideoxygalactose transaminase [Humidesulfovibrio mexicanus]|uniref:dTDP-4-amino-4,6-dideoxygalactose transaminase n=1 Tax=Humidesulfovibrio mexicanus TaxID=147047 RepID=A0A239BVG8_9BACT|nr:DegT/DnrJ/EryC1/StrS family aminotransferase [Humidesulfovibrio mexicanus]SNS11669.1 dTDP-4-amino-4,6-dideoxygalactose transaminase [Humidesulfovibrio mexicanus]
MTLALFGGERTIARPFSTYNSIGKAEEDAALRVIRSGTLSGYLGSWNERFYGGPEVLAFETAFAKLFGIKHAVAFNSLSSGLMASVGALGIAPGDEVIVSPWTMSATATAILVWNAIPVFADIEPETFNLDPASVEANITPRTKAVIVTDIFGHAARLDELAAICARHGLKLVEDAAQAPYAKCPQGFAGCVADVGGFSLNCHKLIQTGEGGVMVTADDRIAERMRLIRNHGEAVIGPKGENDIANIIGYNLRYGEIEAAMAAEQLKRLPGLAAMRQATGERLSRGLAGLEGLATPVIRPGCTHVFYIYAPRLDEKAIGVERGLILDALRAEGVPHISPGYQLLHLLPIYQRRTAHGSRGFPWSADFYHGHARYDEGICPVAERLHKHELLALELGPHDYTDEEADLVIAAFRKVWANLDELRARARAGAGK